MLVAGALVTEIVFAYPGLGHLILQAIQNQDFFLLQGAFLFIVIGVLVANFVIDIVYVAGRPAHADRDAGGSGMTVEKAKTALAAPAAPPLVAAPPVGRTREALYFALRNPKVIGALVVILAFLAAGAGRRRCSPTTAPTSTSGPQAAPPSADFWFGTTTFGQDVFLQFANGMRSTFVVGLLGGGARRGDRDDDRASSPATAAG